MIYFYLPNFFEWNFRNLNTSFIELLRDSPEFFYDNIQIGALYGTFPGVIWNGGRVMNGDCTINEICETLEHYYKLNIPIRFTYTNMALNEEHLQNMYATVVTSLANTGNNEILVNSLLLENHLRQHFPDYKYLSSTTKCLNNLNDVIEESKRYYLTVLDYRKNIDFSFLKSLPNPEKYELLINAYCNPSCASRINHYQILSEQQLISGQDTMPCYLRKNSFFESLEFPTVIKVEDLYTTYVDMGFKHFKIEGRTNHIVDVLESYLYYMVKPEYQNLVRYQVLKNIM